MEDKSLKNTNLPRSIYAIHLRAAESLQGSHEMMDLATGRIFTRPKVTACAMKRMVIEGVELLAEKQGYKTLKFFNRKRKEMMLRDADLLAAVSSNEQKFLDEDYAPLPPIEDKEDAVDPEEERDGDDQPITNREIAALLSDENPGVAIVDNENEMPELIPRGDDDESDDEDEDDGLEKIVTVMGPIRKT